MLADFTTLDELVSNQTILEMSLVKKTSAVMIRETYFFHSILFHHHRMWKKEERNFDKAWNVPVDDNIGDPRWHSFM